MLAFLIPCLRREESHMAQKASNISNPLGTCFVIMPFSRTTDDHDSRYWTTFFKNFLVPTLNELGYECVRSDAGPNNIEKKIVHNLCVSDVVLAILTDFNPNVMYELGVRQSIGFGTIMAIEKGKRVPFDIAPFGVIYYDRNNRKAFREQMAFFLDIIRKRDRLDSPVAEYFTESQVRLIRAAGSVADTPLSNEKMLAYARESLFIIGQNLYSLAKDEVTRDRILEALKSRPELRVRLMIVDPQEHQLVQAISQVVDESMGPDLTEALKHFLLWQTAWLASKPMDTSRFEVRLSRRIGNVSFTFADAETTSGLALVRPILYHTRPAERPSFLLPRQYARDAFDGYYRVFSQEWTHARKLE